jgi:pimeloyl-ACP methyl ester carboxylesterase
MKQYKDACQELIEQLENISGKKEYGDLSIYKFQFESDSQDLLPGAGEYYCPVHDEQFDGPQNWYDDIGTIDNKIQIRDTEIEENKKFDYFIFVPKKRSAKSEAIFLFHGFNEKNWNKYLSWAQFLAESTGFPIILFPMAFHMNRTLSIWSDKRKMFQLSEKRQQMFPDIVNSSLTNVAISMRLHSCPQRFIWSGLQSYYDIIRFIDDVRAGQHPLFDKKTNFNIVAYSIGCLLAEILKLTNPKNYFSHAKLSLFCGGPVFNRLSPVSKFILDSEANVALYSYMVEHLDKHAQKDRHLYHYIKGAHREGHIFHAMLDYNQNRIFREELMRKVSTDLMAIGLKQDEVIPSYEIINTLQGADRDIPIPVDIYDFPFRYNHVSPFPVTEKNKEAIDQEFRRVFTKISDFIAG